MAKKKDKPYCSIAFGMMDIDDYHVPDNFDKDECDPDFSLKINGTKAEELIYINLDPCYKTEDNFYIAITFDVAKKMISAMETIMKA